MSALKPVTLTTLRLYVRPMTEADVPALYAIFSDPEVMRYWSYPALTDLAQAQEMLQQIQASYHAGNSVRLGIERRSDGLLLGTCALFSFHEASRRAEIGYALGRSYWGAGYMHEALSALIDYAFTTLDLHRLEADIDPRNTGSARTLERLGFQKEGHLRERWIVNGEISDTVWYGLLRREWQSIRSTGKSSKSS
ncbi:MAG TPA: GNAT family N-acetyltransferase [Chloroflexi bacterium]|nr:GNAT family N-acetyltransferase [Chloroflexota bacterium]HHW86559.1 GNAT family N-acetyltransferase [Chloroflexota bacterium]